jgi:hypothetical protein
MIEHDGGDGGRSNEVQAMLSGGWDSRTEEFWSHYAPAAAGRIPQVSHRLLAIRSLRQKD